MGAWLADSFGAGNAFGCTSEAAVGCNFRGAVSCASWVAVSCASFFLREGAFAFFSGVDDSSKTRSVVGSGAAGALSAWGRGDTFLRLALAPGALLFSGADPASSCAGSATLDAGWENGSLSSVGETVFLGEGFLARTALGAANPIGLTAEREGPEVSGDKTDSAAAPFGVGVALRTARALGVGAAISAAAVPWGGTAATGVLGLRFTGRFALVGGASGDGAVVGSVILKLEKKGVGKFGCCLGGGRPLKRLQKAADASGLWKGGENEMKPRRARVCN